MEIVYKNIILNEEKISFTIPDSSIIGITGSYLDKIISILTLDNQKNGKINIDKKEITKEEQKIYKKKITVIEKELREFPHITTVKERMIQEIIQKELIIKNREKKLHDALKIAGLNKEMLTRSIHTLSSSEKKLLQIAISLLSNPDIIIFEALSRILDLKAEKKLFFLLQKLKEQYKKTIIIVSEDSNLLFNYVDKIIVIQKNEVLLTGKPIDIYKKIEILRRNNIDIPDIIDFTAIAKKKKKVRIDYHKDVRDIIKDIYKHV